MTGLLVLIAVIYACETILRIAGKDSILKQAKGIGSRMQGSANQGTSGSKATEQAADQPMNPKHH